MVFALKVTCGVPKPSIAILTPYKGQLMEMRGKLIRMGLVIFYILPVVIIFLFLYSMDILDCSQPYHFIVLFTFYSAKD
jgi:hypothetical protein